MKRLPILAATLVFIAGCGSTETYTYDGYLTAYGLKQSDAEYEVIKAECYKHDEIKIERYTCMLQIVPLRLRLDEAFAELTENWLTASRNVALGYEMGNISEETTRASLEELSKEYKFQNKMLKEQYSKIISARNAREKQAARMRTSMALSQMGSDFLKMSANDKSVICRETVPGVVECSEW
jgi:16S rRNA C1402 (ribose-2'-O) methylase RsmI